MYIVDKCEQWPNYIAISEIYISKTLLQSLARCDDKRPYHSMESQKVFVLDDQVAYKLNIDVSKSKYVGTIGKPYARLLYVEISLGIRHFSLQKPYMMLFWVYKTTSMTKQVYKSQIIRLRHAHLPYLQYPPN